MPFNPWGPAGTATSWSQYGDQGGIDKPSGYIGAGTGNGKGPSLGSLWGGAKQADKLGILGYGEKLLGGLFGGGSGLSTPTKSDFSYGGTGEAAFQGWGNALYNRPAVQADLGQFNESRGLGMQSRQGIEQQIGHLRQLANDPGKSQAAMQMKAGGAQNMMQALALARSGGGSGAAQGANLRAAQMGNMQAGQTLNQQTGIMRAQEIAQANQQIGQMQMQQRAFDLQSAGLDAQTAMQQAQLELGSQQLGQQGLLGMLGLGQNASALEQKGMTDYWKTLLGAEAAQMQAKQQGLSALVGGGAALGAAFLSDEQTKMNVTPIYGSPIGASPMQTAGMQVGSGAEMKQNIVPFGMPGQPQISTGGGGMVMPQATGQAMGNMYAEQEAAEKQGFRDRFGKASTIFAAFQPRGQISTQLADPADYLTMSDARAKKLEVENANLRAALDFSQSFVAPEPAAPRQMKMGTTATAQPRLMEAAMRARPQPVVGRPVSVTYGTPAQVPMHVVASDENAKQLRGMLDSATDRLLQYESAYGPIESRASAETSPYWTQQAGERSGTRAPSMDFDRGPRPLAAQAQMIPAAEWSYDPPHAAQANVKNGLPPDHPFGQARKTGPMAQEIAQIPALSGAVMQGPDGMLQVDGGQAAMTGLSMIGDVARQSAEQEERLRRVERNTLGAVGRRIARYDPAWEWDSGI